MAETLVNKNQAGEGIWTSDNLVAGTNISITQVEKPVIDSNTLELLHFNDNALDSISNNVLSTSSYLSFSNGKFGKAGSNSTNYTVQFTAPVSFTKGNSYYTIDCWISSNASGNYNRILRLIFSSAMDCINFGTNSVEIYRMFNNGSQDVTVNYPNNITLDVGVWHHFALVGNGNQTLMFFDGKLFYSTSYTAGNESIAFYGFTGRMDVDELRISNVARWTADFTPYSEPYGSAGATQYQINNTQDVSTKANTDLSNVTKPYVTETYVNGASWYRVYSDGWCEQGGSATISDGTINFLKSFADTNYIFVSQASDVDDYSIVVSSWGDKTTSSIRVICGSGGTMYSREVKWIASGYIQ